MKTTLSFRKTVFVLYAILFTGSGLHAQYPTKEWDKDFGGTANDLLTQGSLQQTSDGGYIMGGHSASGAGGDKTQGSQGGEDYWIIKSDSSGTKQWDKDFGGTDDDFMSCLDQTSDGGYIVGGYSKSPAGGDKTQESQGGYDYWVVKTDAGGTKQWDKRFGGNLDETMVSVQQTTDDGYILGGFSLSGISGDKTEDSRGDNDYWMVKIDGSGIKQWDKRFGGNSNESLTALQQTSDGGYVLGGYSASGIGGDKTEDSRGGYDYWVVKTDSAGVKQWDKRFGGTGDDFLFDLQQTSDGGYILEGYTNSGVGGDKTEPNWDTSNTTNDFWIVKIDSAGTKQWDKRYGGTGQELSGFISQTTDGGYVVTGSSNSDISGDKTQGSQGGYDVWVVKTCPNGSKDWDVRFGGPADDHSTTVRPTADGGYVLGSASLSGSGGDKTQGSQGGYDYWVVKLAPFINTQTLYRDVDGDGYGNPLDSIVADGCADGYVRDNTDCDDNDASVHPDAPEIIDCKDNNCDGVIDGDAPRWTATGSMIEARGANILRLTSGKVLVACGRTNTLTNLNTAELYDPVSGTWSSTGSLTYSDRSDAAVLLLDDRVIVAGGQYTPIPGDPLSRAELYDPTTGVWSLTGSMNIARQDMSKGGLRLLNGKVLVTGGANGGALSSVELYDPTTGSWSLMSSMATGRRNHTATLLADGRVLVAGGDNISVPLDSAELYDPATNSWSTAASMSTPRLTHVAVLLNNGKVLIAGGTSVNSAEVYDPTANTWTLTGTPSTSRGITGAVLLPSGKVLVAGGFDSMGVILASTEVYDPTTNSWSLGANLLIGRFAPMMTTLADGRILVTGGNNPAYGSGNGTLANSELFTPPTAPEAPTDPIATAGDASAIVSWTQCDDGGSAITSFTVTSNPGGHTATTSDGRARSVVVSGLTNGVSYTFTVVATNAEGNGPPSEPSNAVIPGTVPVVTGYLPRKATVGKTITISGSHFSGTTAVSFAKAGGGTVNATTFTVVSDTSLTAKVPSLATTGPITVTNSLGSGVGPVFKVVPKITSFTPTSGPVGTSVTITGTSFTGATVVRFNGTNATLFSVLSDTTITAVVGPGSTTGKISLRTAGGNAKSKTNFTVTP